MAKEDREALLAAVQHEMAELLALASQVEEAMAERFGVNRTDLRCLTVLELRGPMPAGRLAQASGLSPAAMTSALDRLERAGQVQRIRDPHDRRRVLVQPTPAARRRMRQLSGMIAATSRARLARYSDEQLALFRDLLRAGRDLKAEQATSIRADLAANRTAAPTEA
jgi:DNA-binding MarR family transcriptional regulator